MCDGTTPLLQHGVAQSLRVTLTGFRKLDDLVSHNIIGKVATIKAKRYECHFESKTHEPDRLRVEFLAIEVGSDWHAHLPKYRRECYRSLSHRRLGRAAVDDISYIAHSRRQIENNRIRCNSDRREIKMALHHHLVH